MKKLLLLTFSLTLSLSLTKATVRNVPGTYSSIQAALSACVSGDTVLVQPGTYFETIVWPAINGIKLTSAGDSSNTIINANGLGAVITIISAVVDTNTVISGFTITNGFKTGTTAHGGGVYLANASPKFTGVSVKDNAIAAENWGYGAGVYANVSSVVFENSSIIQNHTDSATWGYGGGLYLYNSGFPIFRNVRIEGNTVKSSSWNYGTGVYCDGVSPQFENSTIKNNSAGDSATWCYGTGLYLDNGYATLTNVEVSGNMSGKGCSYYYGTGIYIQDGAATLTNVLVSSNTQSDGGNFYYGAGIYVRDFSFGASGVIMMNVTVTDNKRSNGGNINGPGLYLDAISTASITNSILWNTNTNTEINAPAGNVTAAYSNIRGGYTGTGNINSLPGFVSFADFHLTPSSPSINTGTLAGAPSFDLDNMPRPAPVGTNPDMGCYELNQPLSVNEFPNNNLIEIYPNPASEFIVCNLLFAVKKNIECTITNIEGKKVYSQQLKTVNGKPETKINVSHLSKGIYFVTVDDGEEKLVRKFVKE